MVPGEQSGESLLDAWLHPSKVRAEGEQSRARAEEVIDFLEIGRVADELAGNLSGGQKKLLELGRTMMVDAKIVFLDEVGAGVNRTLLGTITDSIRRLQQERGYTFCVIEHDMDMIKKGAQNKLSKEMKCLSEEEKDSSSDIVAAEGRRGSVVDASVVR